MREGSSSLFFLTDVSLLSVKCERTKSIIIVIIILRLQCLSFPYVQSLALLCEILTKISHESPESVFNHGILLQLITSCPTCFPIVSRSMTLDALTPDSNPRSKSVLGVKVGSEVERVGVLSPLRLGFGHASESPHPLI
jgi:hypothetical protein